MAIVESFDNIDEKLEKKGKTRDELVNELLTIAFNQNYFKGNKRDQYNKLKEELENVRGNLEYKEDILERSASYKMSMKNKIADMEDKIEEKRNRLLEELGSSL